MCWQFSRHARLSSAFTARIGNVIDSITRTDIIPCRVRAVDMQKLLLLLPFLLHKLLEEEVEE
jgi:hypothetical protein